MGTSRSEELRARKGRVPAWWADAKLGTFIHWGMFAVPAFAPLGADLAALQSGGDPAPFAHSPYTEWYENALRFDGSPTAEHHRLHHGGRPYADFAEPFVAGLANWDPDEWARRFADAGSRYVVLVAKHHDGFCLWPTAHANPRRRGWHSTRDVVGELADAVRARGMRFGLYYSGGLDWAFDDRPIATFADLLAAVPGGDYPAYAEAQVRELIERYRPAVLWNDIFWPTSQARLEDLFRFYFSVVPDGVVNDRWLTAGRGAGLLKTSVGRALVDRVAARALRSGPLVPPKPRFFQHRTPEFATFERIQQTPWECVRGMDHGFGFNHTSTEADHLTRNELLRSIVDIAAKGGNLLLNVGPRADGRIPTEQATRLDWLAERAPAHLRSVAGTRPWVRAENRSVEGFDMRFAAHDDRVWAHVWLPDSSAPTPRTVTLPLRATPSTCVTDAAGDALPFTATDSTIVVDLPAVLDRSVWSLGVTGAAAA